MEEKVVESTRQEQEKYEAALREAECLRACAEREAASRKEAEMKSEREAREKMKLESALTGQLQQFQKLTWEEIVSATSSFSKSLKIGSGAYGTVYKCSLHHTMVAVKVLKSNENHKNKQFQQEVRDCLRTLHALVLY